MFDGKRFISTKKASEMTGYAKDYVGQLAREGRVQARLVGRSWYVEEEAVKNHRFGNQTEPSLEVGTPIETEEENKNTSHENVSEEKTVSSRYIYEELKPIPTITPRVSVNLLEERKSTPVQENFDNEKIKDLQSAWEDVFLDSNTTNKKDDDVSTEDIHNKKQEYTGSQFTTSNIRSLNTPNWYTQQEVKETNERAGKYVDTGNPIFNIGSHDERIRIKRIVSTQDDLTREQGDFHIQMKFSKRAGLKHFSSVIRAICLVVVFFSLTLFFVASGLFDMFYISSGSEDGDLIQYFSGVYK